MSPRVIIIHHDDADGRCAAAIIRKSLFANEAPSDDPTVMEFFPMQYNDPMPWKAIEAGKRPDFIFMVDFSVDAQSMARLIELAFVQFIWIDHHISAIEALPAFSDIPGIRRDGTAASKLAWRFCFDSERMPQAVKYIGDRDVWKFRYGDMTRYFYELYKTTPDTTPVGKIWDTWLDPDYNLEVDIQKGRVMFETSRRQLKLIAERFGVAAKIAGTEHTMLKINHAGSGDMGEVVRDLGYDVCHCFIETERGGDMVRINSLYSETVDVGSLAVTRGGGGHKAAAGYVEVL